MHVAQGDHNVKALPYERGGEVHQICAHPAPRSMAVALVGSHAARCRFLR